MSDFLTTRELATLLRVKERKVYDLVSSGTLPFRKVTGKLLFPRKEIETWLGAETEGANDEEAPPQLEAPRALVMAGGHDPLLEWALRESRSGIAAFFDGALDGLNRAAAGDCIAAGLHIPDGDDWNVSMVAERFGAQPWVMLEWARRTRGLMSRPDLPHAPTCMRDIRGLRFQPRQPEAGSEMVLDRLLKAEKMARADLRAVDTVERSETDLAMAIAGGRADVGLGIEAAARQLNLDFVPLVEERFDLLVWRKAYFDPPFQKLVAFCRTPAFAARAQALGGYDLSGFGTVHFNGR
ncbi:helix-turn-helix transcriptional regulator [Xanthobacter agilis]|uniref:Excisionase family DNA binding protein n=1 Tax=Xanthobacter agilis TaxID=47492 RepID=A0ABU0LGV6_XANAG|nr:helix-turn-helix transcriptional regulator [Xanthobacter agilis]MDQ0506376.1 excisionase family DNA binding protein [Xanthobacter agilis]